MPFETAPPPYSVFDTARFTRLPPPPKYTRYDMGQSRPSHEIEAIYDPVANDARVRECVRVFLSYMRQMDQEGLLRGQIADENQGGGAQANGEDGHGYRTDSDDEDYEHDEDEEEEEEDDDDEDEDEDEDGQDDEVEEDDDEDGQDEEDEGEDDEDE